MNVSWLTEFAKGFFVTTFLILSIHSIASEYPEWEAGTLYESGQVITYNGKWYRCLSTHQALTGWEPTNVASIWLEIEEPTPPKDPPPALPLPEPYHYTDNVPPSQNPPGGLAPEQVPMFIAFGFDDISVVGYDLPGQQAMKWLLEYLEPLNNPPGEGNPATFDGSPVRASFYPNSTYMSELPSDFHQKVKWATHHAFLWHHEIGNHTHAHNNNEMSSDSMWRQQITQTTERLILPPPQTESDINHWPAIDSQGAGIPREWIVGFRSPYLNYNDSLFGVLKELGFMYDISIEEGFQRDQDGTNFFWPYTLDNGSPGHEALVAEGDKNFPIGKYPGLWELPAYAVVVPERFRDGIRDRIPGREWRYHDQGKLVGLDYNMWYHRQLTKEEFVETLKHTLDLRLAGNRAPLLFGAHPVEYSERWTANNGVVPTWRERQEAIEEFITYALTKKDVRIVTMYNVLQWMRNPVPLNGDIQKPPQANFNFTIVDNQVIFIDTSTDEDGEIQSWLWEFGNGQTSSEQHPQHLYSSAGNYLVRLTVTDDNGLTHSHEENLTIYINQKPQANFNYIAADNNVTFTNTSSDDRDTELDYNWDFGDGSASSEKSPNHTYASIGNYSVTLMATDSEGLSDSIQQTISLTENQSPTADFTFTTQNRTVQFTNLSQDPENDPLVYSWDFDDGHSSMQIHPSHEYAASGAYTVTLNAVDDHSNNAAVSKTIVISPDNPPTANFSFTINEDFVQLTNTSSDAEGEISQSSWNFGDGNSSNQFSPNHTYTSSGNYDIQLTVTDSSAQQASITKTITINIQQTPEWEAMVHYQQGDLVRFNGSTYQCRMTHMSLTGWTPAAVPALWLVQ